MKRLILMTALMACADDDGGGSDRTLRDRIEGSQAAPCVGWEADVKRCDLACADRALVMSNPDPAHECEVWGAQSGDALSAINDDWFRNYYAAYKGWEGACVTIYNNSSDQVETRWVVCTE